MLSRRIKEIEERDQRGSRKLGITQTPGKPEELQERHCSDCLSGSHTELNLNEASISNPGLQD